MGAACCNNESRVTSDSKIINNQYKTDYHSTNYLNNPFAPKSSRNNDKEVNEYARKGQLSNSSSNKEPISSTIQRDKKNDNQAPIIYNCEVLDLYNDESPNKSYRYKTSRTKKTTKKEFANVKSRYMNYIDESPHKKIGLVNFTASVPSTSTNKKLNGKAETVTNRANSLKRGKKDINIIMNKNATKKTKQYVH